MRATLRLTAPTSVVSHQSAAVLHGLPVSATGLDRVHLTRADVPGGKNRGCVHLHATPLDGQDVVLLDGIPTTSLARTVVDLGRTGTFEETVMAGDAALGRGVTRDELDACLVRSTRRPGMVAARRAVGFLDPRSESPGESWSRAVIHAAMLPPPTLQFEVWDQRGQVLGRSDFGWEQHRTLGEFDGRIKYGRLLRPGETAADAVYREKLREDALRDLGWQVVRWTWADLYTPAVIIDRLLRAFARGGRSL